MTKVFYVCSYGGCGSFMLCKALKKYGKVYHIHSRNPPDKLQHIGGPKCYEEWFNGENVSENELSNYHVIYLYKNPVKSIISRFRNPQHLKHIQTDTTTKIEDVINTSSDAYGIKEFYNNYTQTNKKRNYNILCVKYEEIFEKQDELSKSLDIGSLGLIKKETNATLSDYNIDKLNEIYKDINEAMVINDFILIR